MKRLMVFDLDGTLAKSKSPMEVDMTELFEPLPRSRRPLAHSSRSACAASTIPGFPISRPQDSRARRA